MLPTNRSARHGAAFTTGLMVFLLATAPAPAQTVWSIEGSGPSYGEYNSPPPCPLLPPVYAVNTPPLAACPTNFSFSPTDCFLGGSAVDNNGIPASGGPAFPVMIHSDGRVLEITTYTGAYVTSGPVGGVVVPGPVSGVACDGAADIIYLTDGVTIVGVSPPPGPAGCAPPAIVVPPFFVATPVGVCGLAFDPCTGTLWTCDPAGFCTNLTVGGTFLSSFSVVPFLGTTLTGITVNTTNGNVQVTDGTMVAEFTPTGALAAPGAFYLTSNPYPVAPWGATVSGLGFSLRPQKYGVGCRMPAGVPPSIGWGGGYPFAGNTGFSINQTGATPGAVSLMIVGFTPACPPLSFGCGGIWITAPFLTILGVGGIPASGTKVVPAPLPAPVAGTPPCAVPVGVPLVFQFANFFSGGHELSDALSFTIGLP